MTLVLQRLQAIRAGLTLALAALLCACGTRPPAPVQPTVPMVKAPAPAVDPWARPLLDFERRQRALAEAAQAQGRWAEAMLGWDVLNALRPEDASLAQRQKLAREAAGARAGEQLQRARQAQQRGDVETAARAYLEVLALLPGQPEASEALRALERERVRRQHLGRLSRYALAGSSSGTVQTSPTASNQLNEIEHASLLAEQGEIDSAIALLTPLAAKSGGDSAARRLLAEIHFRRAEGLLASDEAAAVAALERCLQLQPAHVRAVALLKQLRTAEPRRP